MVFRENGKLWTPNLYSVICSAHFIGNNRSSDQRSPSYVPTLFPQSYKRKVCDATQQEYRYHRILKRQKNICSSTVLNPNNINECSTIQASQVHTNNIISTCDISTQVGFEVLNTNQFVFECLFFENNNVSTQITSQHSLSSNKFQDKFIMKADKSCGPESINTSSCLSCDKFHGYYSIKNENALKDLTGTTFKVFDLLCSMIPKIFNSSIDNRNKLLIFLIKMKYGLTFAAIGVLFNIHRTTVSRIFFKCLEVLSLKTKNFIFWPSKSTIKETLPNAFLKNYPNARCIIDCTEIKVQQLPTIEQRVYLYSHYKGCYTVKFLTAITPNGDVSFISKCYGGRSSDTFITNDCGFLFNLEPGDQVLSDKGFPGIKNNVENQNAILVMPPILHNGKFTEEEVLETHSIASVRIHVERFFARLNVHGILNKVPIELLPYIDEIVQMCCVLTNLQLPIIKLIILISFFSY